MLNLNFYWSVGYFSHLMPAVPALHQAVVTSYMLLILTALNVAATDSCAVEFCAFLLAKSLKEKVNFGAITAHIFSLTSLILNLRTVGIEVLTSRPSHFNSRKLPKLLLSRVLCVCA